MCDNNKRNQIFLSRQKKPSCFIYEGFFQSILQNRSRLNKKKFNKVKFNKVSMGEEAQDTDNKNFNKNKTLFKQYKNPYLFTFNLNS